MTDPKPYRDAVAFIADAHAESIRLNLGTPSQGALDRLAARTDLAAFLYGTTTEAVAWDVKDYTAPPAPEPVDPALVEQADRVRRLLAAWGAEGATVEVDGPRVVVRGEEELVAEALTDLQDAGFITTDESPTAFAVRPV